MTIDPTKRSRWILAAAVALLLIGSTVAVLPHFASGPSDLREWTAEQIAKAREASKAEEFLVAIACLSDVLARDPNNSEALALRAAAYLHLNRADLAIDDNAQAIRLDPKNAEAFHIQALIEWSVDRIRALDCFNRAIELSPENGSFYFSRGLFYFESQDDARALADFDRALELNPTDAEINVHRAILRTRLGDVARAWRDFETAVASQSLDDRNRACAHYYRGQFYLAQDELASARREFEQSLELSNAYAADCRTALQRCGSSIR